MYSYNQLCDYFPHDIVSSVECVFKNGSQLFCDNCGDYDYTVITSNETGVSCFYIVELNVDCFVMSVRTLNCKLQDTLWRYKLAVCMAKADSSNIIYGQLPEFTTDVLSAEYLLKILKIEYNFAQSTYFLGKGSTKTVVWGEALVYFITHNTFVLTQREKSLLQFYHDYPISSVSLVQLKLKMEKLLSIG